MTGETIPAMALFNHDHFRLLGQPQVYQTTSEPVVLGEETRINTRMKNGQHRVLRLQKNALVELMEKN